MIPEIKTEFVAICEHDDWYARNHLEIALQQLNTDQRLLAAGSITLRYYHVGQRKYITMGNRGSALCNTVMRSEALTMLSCAARKAAITSDRGVDRLFWLSIQSRRQCLHRINTVVGIKGLPGRPGIGIGHRPDHRRAWRDDPNLDQLRKWIGADCENYRAIEFGRKAGAA